MRDDHMRAGPNGDFSRRAASGPARRCCLHGAKFFARHDSFNRCIASNFCDLGRIDRAATHRNFIQEF
jgi:hypothetical protein